MANTGNVFPGSASNVDRSGAGDWASPGNVTADDGSNASVTVPADYLVCSGFGFSLPSGAVIDGVTLRVEASETGSAGTAITAQLHSDTTPTLIGNSKAQSANTISGTTPTVHTLGATNDVWGATLTPTIVNAAGFGVSIWSTDTTNVLSIDYVTLAIEYHVVAIEESLSAPAGASGTTGAAAVFQNAHQATVGAMFATDYEQPPRTVVAYSRLGPMAVPASLYGSFSRTVNPELTATAGASFASTAAAVFAADHLANVGALFSSSGETPAARTVVAYSRLGPMAVPAALYGSFARNGGESLAAAAGASFSSSAAAVFASEHLANVGASLSFADAAVRHDAHAANIAASDSSASSAVLSDAHPANAGAADSAVSAAVLSDAHAANASASDSATYGAAFSDTHQASASASDSSSAAAVLQEAVAADASASDSHVSAAVFAETHAPAAAASDSHLSSAVMLDGHLALASASDASQADTASDVYHEAVAGASAAASAQAVLGGEHQPSVDATFVAVSTLTTAQVHDAGLSADSATVAQAVHNEAHVAAAAASDLHTSDTTATRTHEPVAAATWSVTSAAIFAEQHLAGVGALFSSAGTPVLARTVVPYSTIGPMMATPRGLYGSFARSQSFNESVTESAAADFSVSGALTTWQAHDASLSADSTVSATAVYGEAHVAHAGATDAMSSLAPGEEVHDAHAGAGASFASTGRFAADHLASAGASDQHSAQAGAVDVTHEPHAGAYVEFSAQLVCRDVHEAIVVPAASCAAGVAFSDTLSAHAGADVAMGSEAVLYELLPMLAGADLVFTIITTQYDVALGRRMTIGAENRTMRIGAENRSMTIPLET